MPYRIVHIADVHLDAAFAGADLALGARRRVLLRDAFDRALELARRREAQALCIAGDLYEAGRAGSDTAEYLHRSLAQLAPMRVFIAPGNHDPFTADSLYGRLAPVPDNVTIFSARSFASAQLADGITLWGNAQLRDLDRDPALAGMRCSGDGTHLLLFHGSDRDSMPPRKEAIAPFDARDIEATGAAYAMVGHFHGQYTGKKFAYPGSLEPLSSAQDGRHTASIVTIEDGRVEAEFVDIAATRYIDIAFDAGRFVDSSELEAALREEIAKRCAGPQLALCDVRIVGTPPSSLRIDAELLRARLGSDSIALTVRDSTRRYDFEALAGEGDTVRASFISAMLGRAAATSPDDKEVVERALLLGVAALSGEELRP